jgi:hypothetical protein
MNSYFTSGILQASSAFLPQTVHSPIFSVSIGFRCEQEPLNSLPVIKYLMLSKKKQTIKTPVNRAKVSRRFIIDGIEILSIEYQENRYRWAKLQKKTQNSPKY